MRRKRKGTPALEESLRDRSVREWLDIIQTLQKENEDLQEENDDLQFRLDQIADIACDWDYGEDPQDQEKKGREKVSGQASPEDKPASGEEQGPTVN